MGRSQIPTFHELRRVFRLTGEVRELAAGPLEWRRHLGEQARLLIGAKVAIVLETVVADGEPVGYAGSVDLGWTDDSERRGFLDYLADSMNPEYGEVPYWSGFWGLFAKKRRFTRSRGQFLDDAAWYGSKHVNVQRRSADVDDFVYSIVGMPGLGGTHQIAFHRSWRDRRFDRRERRLIHILHTELSRSWTGLPCSDPFAGLSPRLRQTLELLLQGDGEKQAAAKLGLSRHTVHRYVTELHRRFNVAGRAELLALCHRLLDAAPRRPRLWLEADPPR